MSSVPGGSVAGEIDDVHIFIRKHVAMSQVKAVRVTRVVLVVFLWCPLNHMCAKSVLESACLMDTDTRGLVNHIYRARIFRHRAVSSIFSGSYPDERGRRGDVWSSTKPLSCLGMDRDSCSVLCVWLATTQIVSLAKLHAVRMGADLRRDGTAGALL